MDAQKHRVKKILVVDDDPDHFFFLKSILVKSEFELIYARTGEEALKKASQAELVLLDRDFGKLSQDEFLGSPWDFRNEGFAILEKLKAEYPYLPVVMITSYPDIESTEIAIRKGAVDYIEWSSLMHSEDYFRERIKRIFETYGKEERKRLIHSFRNIGIIGISDAMYEIFLFIEKVKNSPATVFITGESGVGKELVARAIHLRGVRKDKPFIKVSCANIPQDLLESELFGYEKGAFTGAVKEKPGKFELADGGVIFLDEIGEIGPAIQVKLLRVLEEKAFERLGGKKTIHVDVKIIAATNKPVESLSKAKFRKDLLHRLKVLSISIPPLRYRREDIPPLIDYFIDKFSKYYNKTIEGITKEARFYLENQNYEEGNVRELQNIIIRAIHTAHKLITLKDIVPSERVCKKFYKKMCPFLEKGSCILVSNMKLKDVERELILKRLEMYQQDVLETAYSLGISKSKLYMKLKEYGIKPPRKRKKEE